MPLNSKQLFVKKNFEYHARIAAHAFASKNRWNERGMDIIYQAIMAFTDSAFERGKIEVKDNADWDSQEKEFHDAIKDEAIRRGDWEALPNT